MEKWVYLYQSLKPLESFEMCSKQPEVCCWHWQKCNWNCSDEIGYVKEVIQMITEEWKSNTKLHLEKKREKYEIDLVS
jgi:hypothetical protein